MSWAYRQTDRSMAGALRRSQTYKAKCGMLLMGLRGRWEIS